MSNAFENDGDGKASKSIHAESVHRSETMNESKFTYRLENGAG
jgi:hypothetical protein